MTHVETRRGCVRPCVVVSKPLTRAPISAIQLPRTTGSKPGSSSATRSDSFIRSHAKNVEVLPQREEIHSIRAP